MERIDDFVNYENSYVNVPIFLLKKYWQGDVHGFGRFIVDVLAFGTATEQILRYSDEDASQLEATTQSADDNLDLFLDKIRDYEMFCESRNCPEDFRSLVCRYQKWVNENGGDEWTVNGKWVGITVYNLRKMLQERNEFIHGTDGRKSRERMEQKWMIYFGLKSAIGRRSYYECSWESILNRAMGFMSGQEYLNANLGDYDWTMPFRTKRKTKKEMIERLIKECGLIYSATRNKGSIKFSCRWALPKNADIPK